MFQVKICGITSLADALAAVAAGADAVGLNFYPGSPRYVRDDVAEEISRSLPKEVAKVGVFVGEQAPRIRDVATRVGLDWVQLHGDEPPAAVPALTPLPVLKAFALRGPQSPAEVEQFLGECRKLECLPAGLLFDAYAPHARGGTGRRLDLALLDPLRDSVLSTAWILAGGLHPLNVAEAVRTARPHGVDVASGVESEPGRKDRDAMVAFVEAAREALAAVRLSEQ